MPLDGFPGKSVTVFQVQLGVRMYDLFFERWKSDVLEPEISKRPRRRLVMPLGLLLVVDEKNGGDTTAQELEKRFNLLHVDSRNSIDFYFLGWDWNVYGDRSRGIKFSPESLASCRKALKDAGVKTSGSNAELILVDAIVEGTLGATVEGDRVLSHASTVRLNFREAIYLNLSKMKEEEDIPSVGDFLQSVITVAEEVHLEGKTASNGAVFQISDKLGLAMAGQSFLDFIFDKWGKIIGAKKLAAVAVRDIGPLVELDALSLKGVNRTS